MRTYFVAGYALSALLYLAAWANPSLPAVEGLVDWVAFTKLPLTEFLTLHAASLLGAFGCARRS